jgi:protein ImuB
MERLVCIDLPAFPLQLLLKRRPHWEGHPIVVVEDDRPQATILWVNEQAARQNILPGMRYAAALSVDHNVRAAVVPASEIVFSVSELARRFERFSARVEASSETPGVFWLSGKGLQGVYDSVNDWVDGIRTDIAACGFNANLCAGFTRFGTWAVARLREGVTLFRDHDEERQIARKTPLRTLDLDPQFRDSMTKLGVRTVGDLCDLPSDGLQARYGSEIAEFHRRARGDLMPPLESWQSEEPPTRTFHFDFGIRQKEQILFVFKGALPELTEQLRRRGEGIDRVGFELEFDRPRKRPPKLTEGETWNPRMLKDEIQTASSTLEQTLVVDLLRLKLERIKLPGVIEQASLTLHGAPIEDKQSELFDSHTRRRPEAAMRGLSRVRAEFGEDAVQRMDEQVGYLPEARIQCSQLRELSSPVPPRDFDDTLIRRLYQRPERLEGRPRNPRNDGWLIRGEKSGAVKRLLGPYIISGGWWHVTIKRSYHFAETDNGDLLWVYYDHMRKRWFLHGTVD